MKKKDTNRTPLFLQVIIFSSLAGSPIYTLKDILDCLNSDLQLSLTTNMFLLMSAIPAAIRAYSVYCLWKRKENARQIFLISVPTAIISCILVSLFFSSFMITDLRQLGADYEFIETVKGNMKSNLSYYIISSIFWGCITMSYVAFSKKVQEIYANKKAV